MEANLIAPKDWKENNLHWYESVSEDARHAFAREYCSGVYSLDGQSVVVISYPRQNGRVAVYDMDGGRIMWVPLVECKLGAAFEERFRDSEDADFEWSAILDSILVDEALDIQNQLFS